MDNVQAHADVVANGVDHVSLNAQLDRIVQARVGQETVTWTIFSIFAAAQAVLLAGFVARSGDFAGAGVSALFSLVAVLCAVMWWLMLSRSIKHLHFQEHLIRTLEVALKLPPTLCVSRDLNPEIDMWLRGPRARPLMIAFVMATGVAWLLELVIFATGNEMNEPFLVPFTTSLVPILRSNWQFLAGVIVAVWTVWSFLMNRRDEAAWKRTQFMVDQLRFLDTDPGVRDAMAILEGWNSTVSVDDIFADPPRLDISVKGQHLANFDRLLNLLWCVSYAYLDLKTITWKELAGLGWYLWRVSSNPALQKYCSGFYPEILRAAEVLRKKEKWEERGRTQTIAPAQSG